MTLVAAPARRRRPPTRPSPALALGAYAVGACDRAVARARPQRRLSSVLLLWLTVSTLILWRLVTVQVVEAPEFRGLAAEQLQREVALPATRGQLSDRSGTPLAMSLSAATVYANPPVLRDAGIDPFMVAADLAPVLGRDVASVEAQLRSDAEFVYLGRQLPREIGEAVRALNPPGVGVHDEPRRTYPGGRVAAQVVGFAGVDDTGLAGLELQYDALLGGHDGTLRLERAENGVEIAAGTRTVVPPTPGADLILTLDREVQFATEEILADAVTRYGAIGGSAVVMDPATGELLALASVPTFDPAAFAAAEPYAQRNRAVTDLFEPGSIAKVITVAGAIEEGVVGPAEALQVPGELTIGPETYHDASGHGVATWSVDEIVERSSNIGTIRIAQRLGEQRLHDYTTAFGLGRPTGLDFPGEPEGLLPQVADWSGSSLPTIAIGQGVSGTLLQMAGVFTTIASGGEWVAPQLVIGTQGTEERPASARADATTGGWGQHSIGGEIVPAADAERRRVVSERTAALLADMLVDVVAADHGTGSLAAVHGYDVAGKTGTAQKPLVDARGYAEDAYIASFVGFAPADDPQVVVAVMLDEPTPSYGGLSAAPTFSEIMRFALTDLHVPPSDVQPLPLPAGAVLGGTPAVAAPTAAPEPSGP